MALRAAVIAALVWAASAAPAAALGVQTPARAPDPAAGDVVGSVETVKGQTFILRGGQHLPAERGMRLYARDVIRTGLGSAVGLVLRDESAVSLGPSSEMAVREFFFKPNDGLFSSVLAIVRGTMVYVSGRIAKLAPGAVRVETPVGVAAARGTKLLISVPD